jgi:hypothetical protein
VLAEAIDALDDPTRLDNVRGLARRVGDEIRVNPVQAMVRMDELPPYDYSVFSDQVFLRPYNGQTTPAHTAPKR